MSTPASYTFPRFSSLPDELRVEIWCFAFSPRKIDLGNELNLGAKPRWDSDLFSDPTIQTPRRKIHAIFPVTLYVNHESRAETLRHYCIFYYPQTKMLKHIRREIRAPIRPLCFAPRQDTLCIDARDLRRLCSITWITHLVAMHPRAASRIQEFTIQGCEILASWPEVVVNEAGFCRDIIDFR